MKRIITVLLTVLFVTALLTACGAEPLALDQTELSLTVGESAQLSAGEATKINWLSSDSTVATVNGGTVSAKSAGTAIITASLENGETATCTVTVADKLINVITLDAKSARVEEGKTIQLSASYAPADATVTKLYWESSDKNVASVDEEGYVTGISEGTAEITCKSENGVEASCTVNVGAKTALPTTSATLEPATEKPTQATEPSEAAKDKPTESGSHQNASPVNAAEGFVFPESSTQYLTQNDITARLFSMSGSPVSSSFAQDAINEIYARHGYIFRTPSISAYYGSQPWYHADPSYDGSLSDIEQSNINLLSTY